MQSDMAAERPLCHFSPWVDAEMRQETPGCEFKCFKQNAKQCVTSQTLRQEMGLCLCMCLCVCVANELIH